MFTGIVQHVGTVVALERNEFGAVLRVEAGAWPYSPEPGDSIAVNGCCLTSTPDEGDRLRFDVIRQTLETTGLGSLKAGDLVNLEHAVTPETLLGGHIVQGHIDGVGRVAAVTKSEAEWRVQIKPPSALMECIVEKGSIAVEGTSLTVAAAGPTWFEVALIPTTLERTTLGRLEAGAVVNLETDYIAKTVVNWLRRRDSRDDDAGN